MSPKANPVYAPLFCRFGISLMIVTIVIYVLRGLAILTFIPGGVIYLLFLGAIALGLMSKLAYRMRW